jgi:hypothetical protein
MASLLESESLGPNESHTKHSSIRLNKEPSYSYRHAFSSLLGRQRAFNSMWFLALLECPHLNP